MASELTVGLFAMTAKAHAWHRRGSFFGRNGDVMGMLVLWHDAGKRFGPAIGAGDPS